MTPAFHKTMFRAMKCRSGMAATEFALLLPILTILFFGMLETSDVMTVNRRVAIAVNTMADLVSQSAAISESEVDDLITGVASIVDPDDSDIIEVDLVSVISINNAPVVEWSRDEGGAAPFVVGASFTGLSDDTVLYDGGSLIYVEIRYPYAPRFTNYFVTQPFVFTHASARWPRRSSMVALCDDGDTACLSAN